MAIVFTGLTQYPDECQGSHCGGSESTQGVEGYSPNTMPAASGGIHQPKANPNPERDEWRSEQDLKAQTDMSKWAFWMLITSVAMAALSAVGIFLIVDTLKETRSATAAANRAIDVSREIGRKQAKAYLSFKGGCWWVEHGLIALIEIHIKNTGQSPNTFGKIGISPSFHRRITRKKIESGIGPAGFKFDTVETSIPRIESGSTAKVLLTIDLSEIGNRITVDEVLQNECSFMLDGTIEFVDVFDSLDKVAFATSGQKQKDEDRPADLKNANRYEILTEGYSATPIAKH